jgi:serine phosphatase RsbU (regulator of sigma subunit)
MADTSAITDFATRYRQALSAHLNGPSEESRSQAYELGRQAVIAGVSLLELAVIHEESLASWGRRPSDDASRSLATGFYLEALSTFDMAQRGYLEAQERARIERQHAQRLGLLNQAVLAVTAVQGKQDRIQAALRGAAGLIGASHTALLLGDTIERGRPETEIEMVPDLRMAASKARANDRTQVVATEWMGSGPGWLLATPLRESGRLPGGALLVWRAEPFIDEETAVVEQFASYVSMAVAMAARLEQEHELASTLQRALLPPTPPAVAGMQIAWRYLPGEARDMGGDWYDVFKLDDGDVVLVVGDVMGHDLAAAAVMGQLRLAVQAYALEGYSPTEVLNRADKLMQHIAPDHFATLVYATVDSRRDGMRLSNAGHPPPLLLAADGSVSRLTEALSVPLGIGTDVRRTQAEYHLGPGARLFLYTDGLIEDRKRGLDKSLDLLTQALQTSDGDAEKLCQTGLGFRQQSRNDDICVMCAVIDRTS